MLTSMGHSNNSFFDLRLESCMLASCRILREKKFYLGLGLKPGPFAFRVNAFTN